MGESIGTVISMCKVCDQMIYLVDGVWHHKVSGVWASLPVEHRATNVPFAKS